MTVTFGTADDAAAAQDFGMTELEERLRGPSGAAVRDDVLARLDALARHLVEESRAGLPPAAFRRNDSIGQAIAAARAVVAAFPVGK